MSACKSGDVRPASPRALMRDRTDCLLRTGGGDCGHRARQRRPRRGGGRVAGVEALVEGDFHLPLALPPNQRNYLHTAIDIRPPT